MLIENTMNTRATSYSEAMIVCPSVTILESFSVEMCMTLGEGQMKAYIRPHFMAIAMFAIFVTISKDIKSKRVWPWALACRMGG